MRNRCFHFFCKPCLHLQVWRHTTLPSLLLSPVWHWLLHHNKKDNSLWQLPPPHWIMQLYFGLRTVTNTKEAFFCLLQHKHTTTNIQQNIDLNLCSVLTIAIGKKDFTGWLRPSIKGNRSMSRQKRHRTVKDLVSRTIGGIMRQLFKAAFVYTLEVGQYNWWIANTWQSTKSAPCPFFQTCSTTAMPTAYDVGGDTNLSQVDEN